MASTTYKLSNYNFVVENNGELIVYNSYIGMNSILKISSEELKKIVKPDCERMAIGDNKYVEIFNKSYQILKVFVNAIIV